MRGHTPRWDGEKKNQHSSPEERGWGVRDRDSQRPTPQSQDTTRPPPRKKKATPAHPHATSGPPGRAGASGARARPHTHPNNPTTMGGAQPRPAPSTHANTAHPSRERRGASGARAQTHTRPDTAARTGGARHQPRPNRTPPHSIPNQEVHAGRARKHTHTPTPPQGVAGRSRNPDLSTHAHTAHQNRERLGAGGTRAHDARPIALTTKGRVQAETQSHPQTPQTPAGKRGATPQTVPENTHPRPEPGLAGLPKPTPNNNPDPNTNTIQL